MIWVTHLKTRSRNITGNLTSVDIAADHCAFQCPTIVVLCRLARRGFSPAEIELPLIAKCIAGDRKQLSGMRLIPACGLQRVEHH